MEDDNHARISERARELWETAGRPVGEDDKFWYQALAEDDNDTSMPANEPKNLELRHEGNVIDQRQQQIDPAGKHRDDPNASSAKRSQKQPGQALDNPQDADDAAR
jgi:hypothetical protein